MNVDTVDFANLYINIIFVTKLYYNIIVYCNLYTASAIETFIH